MRVRPSPLAILSLPALAAAVSLSNFGPQLQNLPSDCESVYTESIDACSESDFSSSGCSTKCINALQMMTGPVDQACANHDISGENIIVAFLAGKGPSSVCGNADAVLASESASITSIPSTLQTSTTSATSMTTTSEASTTTTESSTTGTSASVASTDSSTSTSSSASDSSSQAVSTTDAASTSAATTSTTTTSALNVDTSSSPSPASTQSSTSTTSSKSNSQTNFNDGSGGGSPFDTYGNTNSGSKTASSPLIATVLGSIAGSLLLLLR